MAEKKQYHPKYRPLEKRLYAEKIKEICKYRGITMIDLGKMFNQRTGKVAKPQNFWNRVNREVFNAEELDIIADILDCDINMEFIPRKKED